MYRDKLAFITGGSEGIGLALAEELAHRGAHVVILSRDPGKQAAALQKIEAHRADAAQKFGAVPLDVTDAAATDKTLNRLVAEQGVPDFFFACAGFAHPGYLERTPLSAIEAMMRVNYFGTVHGITALVPHFQARRSGTIVTVSSMAGFLGLFGYAGYCASKYAVVGFSEALRYELAPYNIRVSVLCPPNTRTPGLERENTIKPAAVLKTEETISVVQPEAVVEALLKALPKNPFLIIPTWDGRLIRAATKFMPWVVSRLLRRPAESLN